MKGQWIMEGMVQSTLFVRFHYSSTELMNGSTKKVHMGCEKISFDIGLTKKKNKNINNVPSQLILWFIIF